MQQELSGRVALVTGASRGIGAGVAQALGARGARVALNYRQSGQKAFEVADGIRNLGARAEVFAADLAAPGEIQKLFDEVERALGQVDILVNNAGIHQHLKIEKLPYEDWMRLMRVNLDAAFLACKRAIPSMKERGWGRIINISSINAFGGTAVECHYAASKAGLVGLTRALALETAPHGITVNAIAPGSIDTDMLAADTESRRKSLISRIPVGRLGVPADIGHAAAFLASPAASFISGQVIHVNGAEGIY